jgi:PhnB protein
MMKLNPYLMFNGQCEMAFKFYQQCLGGKIEAMTTYGESPMAEQTSPEMLNHVMHAHFVLDGTDLMGSDCPPGYFQQPQGFHVSLQLNNPGEAERIFKTLSENGTVQMPLQETFWAARFGMLVDQFGTPWMINCEPA